MIVSLVAVLLIGAIAWSGAVAGFQSLLVWAVKENGLSFALTAAAPHRIYTCFPFHRPNISVSRHSLR